MFPGFWKADAIAWFAKAAPDGAPMVEEMKIKDKRRHEYKALQTYLEGRAPVKELWLLIAWLRNVLPFAPHMMSVVSTSWGLIVLCLDSLQCRPVGQEAGKAGAGE